MLTQFITLVEEEDARAELKARFNAWWNGQDFDSKAYKADIEAEKNKAAEESALKPLEGGKKVSKAPPRISGLEAIWGRGRYMPGDGQMDQALTDGLGRVRGRIGKVAVVGADVISADSIAEALGEAVHLVDWRSECMKRSKELTYNAVVEHCDLDRPHCFEDGEYKAILSVDAMTYVDHKAGLAARMYRALRDGGRWTLLEYTAEPNFTPKASFASAWAEPQLMSDDGLRDCLETTGFTVVSSTDAREHLQRAAQAAFSRLGVFLEDVVHSGAVEGRDGALMLQELAWEAAAWRARLKALELGALSVKVWVAEKPGGASESVAEPAPVAIAAEPQSSESEVAETWDVSGSQDDGEASASAEEAAPSEPAVEEENPWDADDGEELDQSAVDSLFD